jgi:hypothetical protein
MLMKTTMQHSDSVGCYVQCILGTVLHKSSNNSLIMEEASYQIVTCWFILCAITSSESVYACICVCVCVCARECVRVLQ